MRLIFSLLMAYFLTHCSFSALAQIDKTVVDTFAKAYAAKSEMTYAQVQQVLGRASYDASIIEKISKPAESTMTWTGYRGIFIREERIEAGVAFWEEYQEELIKVSAQTGVPEEIILGIIGVETYFGKIKGSHKVLDALYTLAFGYPPRAKFFKSELSHFLDLAAAEQLDVFNIKGSYAGAMGYCQFMPSSYKAYAKSYEAGGSRDLVNSAEDAIASAANYLKVHGWREGQRIVSPAEKLANASTLSKQPLKPKYSLSYYRKLGYKPMGNSTPPLISTLIQLDKDQGEEYWFGFNNFYVITRYNPSRLYAMAVYQLAEAIKEKRG